MLGPAQGSKGRERSRQPLPNRGQASAAFGAPHRAVGGNHSPFVADQSVLAAAVAAPRAAVITPGGRCQRSFACLVNCTVQFHGRWHRGPGAGSGCGPISPLFSATLSPGAPPGVRAELAGTRMTSASTGVLFDGVALRASLPAPAVPGRRPSFSRSDDGCEHWPFLMKQSCCPPVAARSCIDLSLVSAPRRGQLHPLLTLPACTRACLWQGEHLTHRCHGWD